MPLTINYEIVKLSPVDSSSVDFNTIIFRMKTNGIIDTENSSELSLQLNTLVRGGVLKILFDMKGLESIDSSGIGVIINSAKTLRSNNGDLVLTNVSQEIKNIFRTISLQNFIRVFNTDAEAENHFRFIV